MKRETDLFFGVDYPVAAAPLFANVRASSGWCFHPHEVPREIRLEVNGRHQSTAIRGYPRQDVSLRHPAFAPQALPSGFHCAFDVQHLEPGRNRFVFSIDLASETRTMEIETQGVQERRNVTDVFIDIVGPCNIACTMCPQGTLEHRRGERGGGFMSLALFDRTLGFLQDHGALNGSINLYNWGDPLLHPDLGGILDICRARSVQAILSTNLSYPSNRIRDLSRYPVSLLIVSVSGFSAETYSRNHVRGNFPRVRENLELLAADRGQIDAILLKYLVFRYNAGEVDAARTFCEQAGIQFGAYTGAIPSAESFLRYTEDASYRHDVHGFIDPDWIQPIRSQFCPQDTVITLNHRAELERCCVSWTGEYRAPLFETDLTNYLDTKLDSDFCNRCMSAGYAYYKHFSIARPELLKVAITTA